MTEDDKALVERLRWGAWNFDDPFDGKTYASDDPQEAADRIEALTAENERLRELIKGPAAWLDSWATHVGNCQGGYACTCGLVLARSELCAALEGKQ